jgi:hypothetical protein
MLRSLQVQFSTEFAGTQCTLLLTEIGLISWRLSKCDFVNSTTSGLYLRPKYNAFTGSFILMTLFRMPVVNLDFPNLNDSALILGSYCIDFVDGVRCLFLLVRPRPRTRLVS